MRAQEDDLADTDVAGRVDHREQVCLYIGDRRGAHQEQPVRIRQGPLEVFPGCPEREGACLRLGREPVNVGRGPDPGDYPLATFEEVPDHRCPNGSGRAGHEHRAHVGVPVVRCKRRRGLRRLGDRSTIRRTQSVLVRLALRLRGSLDVRIRLRGMGG